MRATIISGFIVFSLNLSAQIKTFNANGGFPTPNQPKVVSVDTFTILDSVNAVESSNNSDSTLMIGLKDYEVRFYRTDSSIVRDFFVENGIIKNHKKYGKWNIIQGYYDNKTRISAQKYAKYYFNDYEIYFDPYITKSIKINLISETAICDFVYSNQDNKSVNLMINYWIDKNGKVMTNCTTESGLEIFSVNVDFVENELRLLLAGDYNRKIYKP